MKTAPRIAIDYTAALEQGGGIGRYTRELIRAVSNLDNHKEYRLFGAGFESEDFPSIGPNFSTHTSRFNPRDFARIWHRLRFPIPIETWVGDIDLLYAPDFTLPCTKAGVKTLLTVHDLSFITRPETAHPGLRKYLMRAVPYSIKKADHILADSIATKDDIIHYLKTPEKKITVLYSGVDRSFSPASQTEISRVRMKYSLIGCSYILSVGTVQPRKNYSRLIEAVEKSGLDVHLVIVGGKGWLDDPLHEQIVNSPINKRIHLPGFVDDEDLPALYSGAEMTAIVSLYEGFGLPVLESMACGTPVITSDISSLPEVAGDAGILVNPEDTDAIGDAIVSLANDSLLRTNLVNQGYQQSAKFTWESAAEELLSIITALLESS